ncbi:Di-copper centre-containing protein [Mollisia scopiformis]|uniref:tyrosinase n=1 Tax=Mollisia scopiformis TaxID=149040 RepID=A0A194XG95_MOLSC|nr:Di-copper centre-containing protein [Mollisia scopiformis]KUJ19215.1 Di-copper centre-containing protein [Mollisia scopiformis]
MTHDGRSLYLQALIALQQTSEDELLSWFQIAGIHGRPFIPWDGIEWNPSAPEVGYCPHSSVLFTSWHRIYLALLEQVLSSHAQHLAKTYNSTTYQIAADNFRIPYWDYALTPSMPDIVDYPQVLINTSSGPMNVSNPLLHYRFQQFPLNETLFPAGESGEGCLTTYNTTVRFPVNGVSNCDSINANLQGSNLKANTYSVFQTRDYNTMATGTTSNSAFEYAHNQVHHTIGGFNTMDPGHMGVFAYAAFDPIFFLVHANADRLFALWQAMNPTSFLTPDIDSTGTFTNVVGGNLTVDSPLTPFTMVNGSAWTSTGARDLVGLGYSYPEIMDWLPISKDDLAKNVTAAVEWMYGPST